MKEVASEQEFNQLKSSSNQTIFMLSTPWCRKCKVLAAALSLQEVYYIDISRDEFIDMKEFSSIRGMPYVIIYKDNKLIHSLPNCTYSDLEKYL